MSLRLLSVTHQRDAGLGVFAEALRDDGHELEDWEPPAAEEPPSPPGSYDGVIVLGGAMNVAEREAHPWIDRVLERTAGWLEAGTPLLGVCLGSQLLATAAGGEARRASEPEIGWFDVELTAAGTADPVLGQLAPGFRGFQWHSYECVLPPGAELLAESPVCPQAFRAGERAWGIQFHAEVSAADARHWCEDYESDPDAVRIGIDPDALWAETEPLIDAWNELGRGLVRRWAEVATRA